MKKYLIAITMMLAVGTAVLPAAPKHRHQHQSTLVAPTDSAKQGIEAYSDTTSVTAEAVDSTDSYYSVAPNSAEDDDSNISPFERTMSKPWFIIPAIFFGFLIAIAPFLLFAWGIYYLIKRHNDKIALAEKSMAMGQPLPEVIRTATKTDNEYQWQRGIRNCSIGLGLALLFAFLGAKELVGIGFLILCMGAGQMLMARTRARKDQNDHFEDQSL
ncbi:hypothetical protein HMPREF3034_00689 [Prevotella sp. DNF00663]|uniref:DUF6249 domain-containing protein n=1 Tax=Prevotella sp. DNF00663 TaxID=1384078 RepID=UPI0007975583|nr:DUF6249 domain-containing protein [Prevotella sp. DNF00663]KXB84771.1 hypothetical protein HMPREF3034_00689 [Prevotella sp. DNF00663]